MPQGYFRGQYQRVFTKPLTGSKSRRWSYVPSVPWEKALGYQQGHTTETGQIWLCLNLELKKKTFIVFVHGTCYGTCVEVKGQLVDIISTVWVPEMALRLLGLALYLETSCWPRCGPFHSITIDRDAQCSKQREGCWTLNAHGLSSSSSGDFVAAKALILSLSE